MWGNSMTDIPARKVDMTPLFNEFPALSSKTLISERIIGQLQSSPNLHTHYFYFPFFFLAGYVLLFQAVLPPEIFQPKY
jgi:hypothetical protein